MWLSLVLAGVEQASAIESVEPCAQPSLRLLPALQYLLDPDSRLNAAEVAELPDERFREVTGRRFPVAYSSASVWLRFTLQSTDTSCTRWLKVGEPRLERLQVFTRSPDGNWREMRAGSDFPLEHWSLLSRQPLFPLVLEKGRRTEVVARVMSRTVLMIDPYLWDDVKQQQALVRSNLFDGLALGIVLLIVPFGFVIGLIRRSSLVILNVLSILTYGLVCFVANGYLFYVPQWMTWKFELLGVFGGLTFALFIGYMRILFGVRVLPGWMRVLLTLYTVLISGLLMWGAVGDYRVSRSLFSDLRWTLYVVVPLSLAAAWYYGRRPTWLAGSLAAFFVLQGVARHILDVKNVSWQYGEDQLGLTSALPGVLLLVCTLVMEFRRSRMRERQARAELEEQRRAEHERLEGSVARRTEQLRESLRARSMLLARISHDLRSPLVSIIDHARALGPDGPSEIPQRIERNVRRQLEMIDELLEFSRSELQQLELVLAPGYLYGFLREIEDEGRFLALRQDNVFVCEFADDLPPLVQADFRRLRQVLINLLTNAAKFTRDGFIQFRAERVADDELGVTVRFSVNDSGIGIRTEMREQLLQPFQRGSNVTGYDGAGLGLSIVSQLLQQMGSELSVDFARERGAGLAFELKMALTAEGEVESVLSDNDMAAIDGDGRRVLVVDDIQQNRESLSDLLAGYGFDVLTASNGEQALETLLGAPVDLLITDQMMSPIDGWMLLSRVRTSHPHLPVLLYSAAPPLRPENSQADLMFDAALLKPATSGDMVRLVSRFVDCRSTS